MSTHTVDDIRHAIDDAHFALDQCRNFLHGQAIATGALNRTAPPPSPLGLLVESAIKKLSKLSVSLDAPGDPGGTVDVEALAQMLSAADVHVNDGDYPRWDDLAESGQEQYLTAARWLLSRLDMAERTVDAETSRT
ncbi:hypothetical protein [Streptomyces sp. NPDC056188]|uniref:hypothetical protein n=1 Tax=Streptomyces sp. NPDC056188 TaxID=3345740 RepID=UPI0035DA0F31